MYRVTLRSIGLCLGAALFTLSNAPHAQSAPSPKLVEGDVKHAHGFFTAGPMGATIALPGKAHVQLAPHATARVFSTAQSLRMPAGYAVSTWSVVVQSGRVTAVVNQPKTTAVLLTASAAFSTVIASGKGVMLVDRGKYTAANLDGVSHTIISGRWQELDVDTIRSWSHGQAQATSRPRLSRVHVLPSKRLWIAPGRPTKLAGFSWKPVAGATEYTAVLTRAEETEPLATLVTHEPRLNSPFEPVGPGRYALRVHAVDEQQLPGRWSESVELHVVGVDLPEGAYVSHAGGIHLGHGQQAHFTNAEGLELTYSGAWRYLPATSGVALNQDKATIVSFRKPGSVETVVTKLLPRNIKAEIEIGPQRAVWPRDEVEVSIQVREAGRGPAPAFVEPRAKVTVNIDPVEVDWHWDGSTLRGSIPPSSKRGPWVVRVEVEDQFGVPLGRNLLEVVPGQKNTRSALGSRRERVSRE